MGKSEQNSFYYSIRKQNNIKNIMTMAKILTKQFQYSGNDDFDTPVDAQINEFLQTEGLSQEDVIDIKYEGHSVLGVSNYSALIVYKAK